MNNVFYQNISESQFPTLLSTQSPNLKRVFSIRSNENDYSVSESTHVSIETESKRQADIKERYAKSMQLSHITDIENLRKSVIENPELFYKLNNVTRFPPRSPFSKQKFTQIEKHIETVEGLLRKWTKLLKLASTACVGYVKSIEAFSSQLLSDANVFEYNKELQHIVVLVAQFMKENAAYLEIFSKVMDNSVTK